MHFLKFLFTVQLLILFRIASFHDKYASIGKFETHFHLTIVHQGDHHFCLFKHIEEANAFNLIQQFSVKFSVTSFIFCHCHLQTRSRTSSVIRKKPRLSSILTIILLLILSGDVELNPGPFFSKFLHYIHLNICSIRNKSTSLHNFLCNNPADIISLNETWLQPSDTSSFLADIIPPGFSMLNEPRSTGIGGGVAFLFRSSLKLIKKPLPIPVPKSFEAILAVLDSGNKRVTFLNIYRPPSSSQSDFFSEFQNLLEILIALPSELILSGDFNFHMNTQNNFST